MTATEESAKPKAASREAVDRAYCRKLLLVVMLAVMGFGSLMTIVTVALSSIAKDLNSSRTTLGWIVTGLMLTMAVLTPIMGKLGDLHGHRRMLLIGLAGSVVTTTLCGLAWSGPSLIAARVLFGVTGAAVTPNGMSLMMQAYGPSQRAKAVGWYQFAMTGAPTLGLIVGGPLINVIGWRPVFFGFAVITALAFVVAYFVVRESTPNANVSLDLAGAFTLGLTVLSFLLAVSRAGALVRDGGALADPLLALLIGFCVAGLAGFIRAESRAKQPLIRLTYFRRRNFVFPLLGSALNQFAYMGGFVVTPILLGDIYGYAVGTVALLMIPRPAVFSVVSPLGGWLTSHKGERLPMVIGTTAMITSMLCFAGGSRAGALWLVLVGLALSGLSAGVGAPAFSTLAVSSVDERDLGVANGMTQTTLYLGIVTGIQTMLVVLGEGPSPSRYAVTYLFGAAVAGLGLVAAMGARPGKPAH